MFESLSSKFKAASQLVITHKYPALAIACIAILIVIAIFSLTQIAELKSDVHDYENQIVTLTTQMQQWEQAAAENEILLAENKTVISENIALTAENESIIATNGELERQNGELVKKFDGLSKPQ